MMQVRQRSSNLSEVTATVLESELLQLCKLFELSQVLHVYRNSLTSSEHRASSSTHTVKSTTDSDERSTDVSPACVIAKLHSISTSFRSVRTCSDVSRHDWTTRCRVEATTAVEVLTAVSRASR